MLSSIGCTPRCTFDRFVNMYLMCGFLPRSRDTRRCVHLLRIWHPQERQFLIMKQSIYTNVYIRTYIHGYTHTGRAKWYLERLGTAIRYNNGTHSHEQLGHGSNAGHRAPSWSTHLRHSQLVCDCSQRAANGIKTIWDLTIYIYVYIYIYMYICHYLTSGFLNVAAKQSVFSSGCICIYIYIYICIHTYIHKLCFESDA